MGPLPSIALAYASKEPYSGYNKPYLSVAKRGLCTLHLAQVVFLAESREIGERHTEPVKACAAGTD